MSTNRVTLRQQAEAVELAALNRRGHIQNLTEMVAKGRRPFTDIEIARLSLPALEAAAATLQALAEQERVRG